METFNKTILYSFYISYFGKHMVSIVFIY